MFVRKCEGRDYHVCNNCKKPYSFKTGKYIRPGMERFCRHCSPQPYPTMPKKSVKV